MLLVLRGRMPSSPLVWSGPSGAVTGETGGGVASPQKSSELNKPPSIHQILIHSVCAYRQLQKKFFFQAKKRRGSCLTKLLWQCANLPFGLLDSTIFYSFCVTLLSFSYLLSCLYKHLHALLYCSSISRIAAPSFFLSVYVSFLFCCCCPAICFSCNAHFLYVKSDRFIVRLLLNEPL